MSGFVKMSKLRKLSLFPWQDTAVGFYRIIQPGRFLKREGLVEDARTVPFTGDNQTEYYEWSDKTLMAICEGTDIIWSTLLWKQKDILKLLDLRHHYKARIVIDLDDNIWGAPSDNPAKTHADTLRENRDLCLSLADGVTVSVPLLKDLVGNLNKNVFVQPNGLDFKIWDPLRVRETRKIRIGWRGAWGHKEDLEMIEPVIRKIKEAYPKVEFVSFGYKPPFSDENYSWVSFQKYPETLAKMGIDIAVVPLVDSAYNRCKSNLAYLEWSALKIPVVYSPTENQKNLPGFAASSSYEWYEALSKLIEDRKLRRSTADLQNFAVKEKFSMSKLVVPLADWMAELPRRQDLEP